MCKSGCVHVALLVTRFAFPIEEMSLKFLFCLLACIQINANTPESVFQFLEFVKELLLFVHKNYILPGLQYIVTALQHLWQSLQDSCKSVPVTAHLFFLYFF